MPLVSSAEPTHKAAEANLRHRQHKKYDTVVNSGMLMSQVGANNALGILWQWQ